jgi:hypothetical protein
MGAEIPESKVCFKDVEPVTIMEREVREESAESRTLTAENRGDHSCQGQPKELHSKCCGVVIQGGSYHYNLGI